jgi:hypothetical protein
MFRTLRRATGRNPKSETRNPKQIQMNKTPNAQNARGLTRFEHLDFGDWCLFRISDFVFRIWMARDRRREKDRCVGK